MNNKIQTPTAFLLTALAGGAAKGAIVSSGPLDLVSTYNASGSVGWDGYGRDAINIVNGNSGPDLVFGYDTASDKPYVDARSSIGVTNGLVTILAGSNGGTSGNGGLPFTSAGTLIGPTYAGLYPGNSADDEGMFNENANNNGVAGQWSNSQITDGYVGIELNLGSGTDYGWMEFQDNPTASSPVLTLEGWAYDTTPGEGIVAGVVPEPSAVALLGVGALGFVASLRKRRK
ncbi:MAG TPA: PEP-CTERM sorting domain-containing protein [Verrucomicrobiae bacterium]